MCPGATTDAALQRRLEEESRRHGDLVQGDFLDTYHNLSYKAVMGNLWVAEFCSQAQFVVKTDDDMYVDLYEVVLQKVASELHPKVRNHGEGPYLSLT